MGDQRQQQLLSPPPGADLSQGSWDIRVSTVGGNDPHDPSLAPQHDPRPVVLKCTVEDAAGQRVTVSRKVDAWYPVSYFVPGTAMPLEPPETMERVLDILPEVRERLLESRAPNLPPELEGKLAEHIERTIDGMAQIEVDEFEGLARDVHPDLHPEDPIFDTIPRDEHVLRFWAADEVLLNQEVALDHDVLEKTSPQVVGDLATVGHIEMVYEAQIAPDTQLRGGELLADLGFEAR